MKHLPALGFALLACLVSCTDEQEAPSLRTVLGDSVAHAEWIYDDVEAGLVRARASGKPLMIVFR